MLDFRELPENGRALELLVREILFGLGQRVYWSGEGPDGGKDLLCHEDRESIILPDTRTWLIQCKHYAHSGRSVGLADLDDIVDSCAHHGAQGYLLVCSTHPSSKVVERLQGITANPQMPLVATSWDAVQVERMLSTPRLWRLAQRFFPASATGWDIYATERPNQWIANYRGYYFHLNNRIGSRADIHLERIAKTLDEIEAINLPPEHFIRLRAVYFDDKHGDYQWYVDYMYPYESQPAFRREDLMETLHDGDTEDGQLYYFDVIMRPYHGASDHYDPDHYDYYAPYLDKFRWGGTREK